MRKEITNDMVNSFNSFMEDIGSIIRLKRATELTDYSIRIVLPEDRFIESFIINLSQEFYDMLINYFNSYEIELSFNNIKSIFWSKFD